MITLGTYVIQCNFVYILFFNVRLLSVLHGHSFFSSPPQRPMTSDFEDFSIPDFIHYIYLSYLNSRERASIFPFECSVLNKGATDTIFITSLVWRGPWLGIEPGTSRTQSWHYTTRLSRRRYTMSGSGFIDSIKLDIQVIKTNGDVRSLPEIFSDQFRKLSPADVLGCVIYNVYMEKQ